MNVTFVTSSWTIVRMAVSYFLNVKVSKRSYVSMFQHFTLLVLCWLIRRNNPASLSPKRVGGFPGNPIESFRGGWVRDD